MCLQYDGITANPHNKQLESQHFPEVLWHSCPAPSMPDQDSLWEDQATSILALTKSDGLTCYCFIIFLSLQTFLTLHFLKTLS